MVCDNPIGVFRSQGKEVPAPCNKWSCPECSKKKKNQVLDRAGRGLQLIRRGGGRIRAVTLTLGPRAENELAGKYLGRLRAYLAKPRLHRKKYRSFRGINYFWTKEFQENGQLHFHMLIDAYIPVAILRKAWKWATYGTSKIVFITKTWGDIQNPAGYMTKYMSKEINQDLYLRQHERRYGFSRSWRSPFLLTSYRAWLKLLPGEHESWSLDLHARILMDPWIREVTTNILKEKAFKL